MYGKKYKLSRCRIFCNDNTRAYYIDEQGQQRSILLKWTDLSIPDPFIELSQGRSYFRYEDLNRLSALLIELKKAAD